MNKKEKAKLDALFKQICENRFTNNWDDLNYKFIPITVIPAKIGNEEAFNELYQLLLKSNFAPIKRTPSGGISINAIERYKFDKFDIRQTGSCVELTIATLEKSARIQFRLPNYKNNEEEELISAGKYFKDYWIPTCKKHGISMNDYKCDKEEALKYKEKIHLPDIAIYDTAASYNVPYQNAYHLDFHKFYISGLIDACPEFEPVVNDIMKLIEKAKLKKDKKTMQFHKTGLAAMIGYFQSKYIDYKYSKLSMLAINNAYSRFDKVKEDLKKSGRRILATNTDGIWYVGQEYHGEFEGPELKHWNNDHKECIIRFKSAGSYEFIEAGKYNPVVRGRTRLDLIKPRSSWVWGDIFDKTAEIICWRFEAGIGIIWKEDTKNEKN